MSVAIPIICGFTRVDARLPGLHHQNWLNRKRRRGYVLKADWELAHREFNDGARPFRLVVTPFASSYMIITFISPITGGTLSAEC